MNKTTFTLLSAAAFIGAAEIKAQTTPAPQPSICNRACWTARAPSCSISQNTTLNRAIIHHTANQNTFPSASLETSKGYVRGHQNGHMDVNGWCDIGYHFLVDSLGNIFEGRQGSISSLPRGAHDGCNTDSMGFSLMGYFHSPYNQTPTTVMLDNLYNTIAWKMPSGWTPYGSGTYCGNTVGVLDGHRKVKATACPGDIVFNNYIGNDYNAGAARTTIAAKRTPGIIVDNTDAGFTASSNWTTSTSVAGYYGTNYRPRATEAVSDVAKWDGVLAASGSYQVFAWWAASSNRSTTAPYLVERDGGTTTVNVNQQINGGQWNSLGTFTITSGTRFVKLSCWTTTGFFVIADAVKWVKQ